MIIQETNKNKNKDKANMENKETRIQRIKK